MINNSVPVLYYHRVGSNDPIHLSIPESVFDAQMKYLADNGYNVISVSQFYHWLIGRIKINFPAVCITFDDGFLDNYLFAHNILKKYNFKVALFMATSLIRPQHQKPARKLDNFNDAHTKARKGDFSNFLSLNELKNMSESGIWEIYSHSHNHNQVFISEEVTGVYPDTDKHWGILSAYGCFLQGGGWPVFKRTAGLIARGHKVVKADNPNSVKLLRETEQEYKLRVVKDLQKSLEIIKSISPDLPELICWPWGKANDTVESVAAEVGYVGAFRTDTGANTVGMNPMKIKRFPVKKKEMWRFKLGIWLRKNSKLATLYAKLRNL